VTAAGSKDKTCRVTVNQPTAHVGALPQPLSYKDDMRRARRYIDVLRERVNAAYLMNGLDPVWSSLHSMPL
jgi:uncharacterized protein YjdB